MYVKSEATGWLDQGTTKTKRTSCQFHSHNLYLKQADFLKYEFGYSSKKKKV